jgi:hypothetical protein
MQARVATTRADVAAAARADAAAQDAGQGCRERARVRGT